MIHRIFAVSSRALATSPGLAYASEFLGSFNGIVITAFKRVGRRQVMDIGAVIDIGAVMASAVELILRHPHALIHRGRGE